ncbi:MAG: type I-C CRISPR-associated protein Cas7/Csd2 [Chloroflexota bacterium]
MTAATATPAHLDPARRHDFVLLFDVTDGNPNGDPDAGNLPRVDPETMQGLVTDVCIKRKVRDFVDLTRGQDARYKIYVQSDEALNSRHQRAYTALEIKSTGTKQNRGDVERAQAWMCANFFDVRSFGAVMSTGVNCGQVRGPIQLTFARSVDQIVPLDITLTRIAITKAEDLQVVESEDGLAATGKRTEMGRKAIVPYGLYRAHGFFNAHFAAQTGVDSEDLALLWQALMYAWDHDRSASRGLMACRGLYVFSHESSLGNAPAHKLFAQITAKLRPSVDVPRSFGDYAITVDEASLPSGVTLTRLVE